MINRNYLAGGIAPFIWFITTFILVYLNATYRFITELTLFGGAASFVCGIFAALIVLKISLKPSLVLSLALLISFVLFYMIAFPTQSWHNPLLWNWPLWGVVSLTVTMIITKKNET